MNSSINKILAADKKLSNKFSVNNLIYTNKARSAKKQNTQLDSCWVYVKFKKRYQQTE